MRAQRFFQFFREGLRVEIDVPSLKDAGRAEAIKVLEAFVAKLRK